MNVFYWIALSAVIVMSSARITRLMTYDQFPPTLWLRNAYADWTEKGGNPKRLQWQLLMFCGYCFSFWATLAIIVWAWLAGVLNGYDLSTSEEVWWLVNGTFGAAYAAAIVMAHDGDTGEDD